MTKGNDINELREHLFATLRGVRDKENPMSEHDIGYAAHDIGYAAGWRNCADNAALIVAAHIDRFEPGRQQRTRDALLDLLASMRSILVSQRAAKETSR